MRENSRKERMITGSASSEALNNSIAINGLGGAFIKNANKLLVNGFGTSQSVKNENESMLGRFDRKEIKILSIINKIEIIAKNGYEVVNGNAKTSAALSANDVVLRLVTKERNNFSNIIENDRINFARNGIKPTQVFSKKNASIL